MKQLRSLLVAVFFVFVGNVLAQPANDNFASAFTLVGVNANTNGNNTGASNEAGEPDIQGNAGGRSVWYEWTAPATGVARLTIASGYRNLAAVYTGDAVNAVTPIATAASGFGGNTIVIQFVAFAGTNYKVTFDGRNQNGNGGNQGPYTLSMQMPPSVGLASPTNGQFFTGPTNITLTANAAAPGGSVTNVSYYFQTVNLIGSATTSPFTVVWSNVPPSGPYALRAVANADTGLSSTSATVNINVRPEGYFSTTLVNTGSVWKYLDNGSDQGTAWQGTSFDDSTWASGPAELGYGDAVQGRPEATVVADNAIPGYVEPSDGPRFITTYFRRAFMVTNAASISNLTCFLRRDDGGIVYLNGTEIQRNGVAAGPVDYLTPGINAQDEVGLFPTNVNQSLLIEGVNHLAVEIHQESSASSDISFDLALVAEGVDGNQAPAVAITSPTNNAVLRPGTNLTITATASDSEGSVTNVAFYVDGQKLADDIAAPYAFTWNNVPQGVYTLTAVATDNQGASRTSTGVDITVNTFTIVPVTLIPSNSVWKYLDNGSDQGTAWRDLGFNDSAWLSGPAELGYGDTSDGRPEATLLGFGPDANAKYTNYYFRTYFTVTNPSLVTNLIIRLVRDDGAVVYINGAEVRRDGMPLGVITSTTRANVTVSLADEATFFETITNAALNLGTNVIAVEVHQENGASSDISFNLELIANTLQGATLTNTVPPFVLSRSPAAGATLPSLTSVQVTFNEAVTGVDAADMLVNGTAASGLSGGGNLYTFTFPQPPFGPVNITWAGGHGIVDQGAPQLAFNGAASSNMWSYTLADNVAPTITAKTPAAGATVTNLTSVNVSFSENVNGVNAGDLLINGSAASGLAANSASNYTFSFAQPGPGAVNISWIAGHGIADTSPSANAFNSTGPNATWAYTFAVPSTVIIPSNTVWRFIPGTNEASNPIQAWRDLAFDDSSWSNSATPFFYGDPYTNLTTGVGTDFGATMQGIFQCIYLRYPFVLTSPSSVSNFIYRAQIDDGLVAWINGVEVLRINMGGAPTDPPFQTAGVNNANEPTQSGAGYISVTNTLGLGSLVAGTNILTVQAFNASLAGSSDFGFNLQFEATVVNVDPSNTPPRIATATPSSGDLFAFNNLNLIFNEPVTGVNAADLLINGSAATGLTGSGSNYTFTFPQPPYGNVAVTWAVAHAIADFDAPPKPFDGAAPGSTFNYTLINPSAPTIVSQTPLANSTLTNLTQLQITFSETVQGVNAADLLINGVPATGLTGSGANYTFTFPRPAYGQVGISWATGHNIRDTEPAQNAFDPARPGATWQYTLIDQTPPTVAAQNPVAGANVTNLTSLTVTFSETVQGVNAADLLINGAPATGIAGGPATYTFTFALPNTSPVNITWAGNHGISDTAAQPNAFSATAPGATWTYFTPDSVAPTIAAISPAAGATVRALTTLTITFAEPVSGVTPGDLLINNVNATQVAGSAAGPYTFQFTQPATGLVQIAFAPAHGITDLATPPNPFGGGEWNYVLNPNAVFADKIVLNEIYFHPSTERTNQEWIELHNTDTSPVNLTGWRLTKGVGYTFPNVSMAAGGYLVIAASVEEFQTKYPGVTNVVGGWTGQLGNTDEEIELETVTGERVDTVHYADEGDWALRQRGPLEFGARGWEWFSAADGTNFNTGSGFMEGGRSLELRNPAMPNQYGQNWTFSAQTNGTPGAVNGALTTNIPPMVLDVVHSPAVPASTDTVTITARIRDEQSNGVAVTLFQRNHTTTTPPAFTATTMFDDGVHNDGAVNDGVFGVVLPAQPNGTVIEFYVQAIDAGSRTNTWPAAARQVNGTFAQTANALYQVDNETAFPNAPNQPVYRVIMTESERVEYLGINPNTDAEMNATFISIDGEGTKVRYLSGVRIRGAGSRGAIPKNNRINVPSDNRWNGLSEVNLNSQYTHLQTMGSALALKSGLPSASARPVQYRMNGVNPASSGSPQFGSFVFVEPINGDWAEAHYPNDSAGNAYRASTGSHNADFTNFGTNGNQYINRGYSKTSNQSENDWSDMNFLTLALSTATPDSNYVAAITTNINVVNWMRYFAVCSLLEYSETSLCVGRGDDYAMYRGVADNRFTMIPHDFDTVLGGGDSPGLMNANESIWAMVNGQAGGAGLSVPILPRFVRHPQFVPVYFAELKRLAETVFSPTNVAPLIDQLLGDWAASTTMPGMKTFAAARTASVLSQIPLTYSLVHTLTPSNGVLRSTTSTIILEGTANAIDTRVVRVNGAASAYSAWEGRWTNNAVVLQPGLNNLLIEAVGASGQVVWSTNFVVWYDVGTFNSVSGTISANTIWSAGSGPYRVTANMTVASGATLTVQPGTTVYLNSGVGLSVANGGRLLAEGNANARIQFNMAPGPSNRWSGIVINGSAASPESRITYTHIEGNNGSAIDLQGGDAYLDHLTFGTTDRRYINLDGASFVVSHSVFPATTGSFEPLHGTGGIRTGGRGIFLRNFFGRVNGYNDTVDFTGGNRPGPIVQFIENVFMGSDDDLLDIDGTDAWVEGNIFLHAHRNGSPDSSSGVSGGNDSGQTSEITVIGNLFYDVDQAATAKQGNHYTFINNTVVHQSGAGFGDAGVTAVLNFADDGIALANGMYVEGNIMFDVERLTRNLTNGTAMASNTPFNNNLMPFAYGGPGTNNSTANPLLKYIPQLAETAFTSWEQAQIMREWFSLQSGSPGLATGPNGRDQGGVVPLGVSISGEPGGTNALSSATLLVGVRRSGNGIPATGFPNGSGYTHYKWRLDSGVWSAETPTTVPISLNNLAAGAHSVEVAGKRDANFYQDDAVYGPAAVITQSRTWFVNTNGSVVRINEILAANNGVFVHSNTTPDAIELFNTSAVAVNLEGFRLTDDSADPDKFIFGPGATIAAGGYLVVFADNDNTPGIHLGFTLAAEGETLFLYDSVLRGGALLETVSFGWQLPNLSVGRLTDGSWNLTLPSLSAANLAAATGDPLALRINEWLAVGLSLSPNDFIELFNMDARPVPLGGLFLTDQPNGWPNQYEIAPLSFIAGGGYRAFFADGEGASAQRPADHLNFTLTPEQGMIGLLNRNGSVIDCIVYGSQRVDISQGRSPNGSSNILFFAQPTPGAPNQSVLNTNSGVVINEVFASNASYAEADGSTPDWVELFNLSTNAMDVGDMSFTDVTAQARRYVFAAGTTIPALGYLRLRCDPLQAVSGSNTGFGLKATGGSVFLFDKLVNGGGLLNSVSHGLQAVDFAIGRVPNGTGGFALTVPTPAAANNAAALGNVSLLKVNEWMAQPSAGDDWFEIYNPNVQPVSIGGLFFSDTLANRVKSPIPALSFLGGGTNGWQRFWADSNPGAGADHANFGLSAGGETVALSTSASFSIDSYTFGAQQTGVSEGRFTDGSATIVRFPQTASPGDPNYLLLANIVINEALTHSDPPFEDAIELRNLTGSATNVGNWWLSDAKNTLRKYRIAANTIIPANGYIVFYENQFNFDTNDPSAFSLSSGNGDQIYLSTGDTNGNLTGYRATVDFDAAANGVSFGRYVTSDQRSEFVAMSARSFGQDDPSNVATFRTGTGLANPYPKVGPVVIAQIMFRPPDIGTNDNSLDEFIELRNTSAQAVPLYDATFPTNTWRLRDAVDFNFPQGVSLPAGGKVLVVSFDPIASPAQLAAFRSRYGADATVPVFGPYSGKLANNDDDVELHKPDAPNANSVPYVLVERVHYFDIAPWTPAADGTGAALQRVSLSGFGNDPTNWVAAVPNFGGGADTDGDGIPNSWETQYGLNPNNPADANVDSDGDGLTNLQEYLAGTNPTDSNSALRITSIESTGGNIARIKFFAVSNKTYTIEFKNALTDPSWARLIDITSAPSNRIMQINTAVPSLRFYQLRTPQAP